jgi:hypothetical protein
MVETQVQLRRKRGLMQEKGGEDKARVVRLALVPENPYDTDQGAF